MRTKNTFLEFGNSEKPAYPVPRSNTCPAATEAAEHLIAAMGTQLGIEGLRMASVAEEDEGEANLSSDAFGMLMSNMASLTGLSHIDLSKITVRQLRIRAFFSHNLSCSFL